MVFNKKAISPVVATALLLVVAVVAVVGFQQWFQTYNSGLMADVDEKSATSTGITVEMVQAEAVNSVIYLKNPGSTTINGVEITVDAGATSGCVGVSATINITSGINSAGYPISGCALTEGDRVNVVMMTADAIFQQTAIAR